jgi:hypothetical protein
LTAARRESEDSSVTAEYVVIPAPFPCSAGLFSCSCGATAVEYDLKRVAPEGWSTAEDGSCRCPRCTAEGASRASNPASGEDAL